MRTKYKYIEFFKQEQPLIRERVWRCRNRKKIVLGHCEYSDPWYEWEFCPEAERAFSIECVRDIADFLAQLNAGGPPK